MSSSESSRLAWGVSLAVTGLAFVADLLTPIGITVWVFYLPAILNCMRTGRDRSAIVVTTLASVFLFVGYFLSPSSLLPVAIGLSNRCIGFAILWICAGFVVQAIRKDLECKSALENLKQSEERHRIALEATDLGTWDEDLRTGHLQWNRTAFAIYGEPTRDTPISAEFWSSRIHSEDWPRVHVAIAEALANDALYNCEHRILRTSGGVRWIAPFGRFFRDAQGTPSRFIGVFRDISEQKFVHQSMAENQEALKGHNARQALLLRLSGALIAGCGDEIAIVRQVFDQLSGPLQLDLCLNYRLNMDSNLTQLVASVGLAPQFEAEASSVPIGEGFCGTVATSRKSLIADEARIATDPLGAFVRQQGVRAYVCHPLMAGSGGLLGTLSFASRRKSHFTVEESAFLQTVCHFVALAWERLASDRALRTSEETLQLALRIGQIGHWSWWPIDDRIEWSDQLCLMNGFAPGEFGATLAGLLARVHAEDRERLQQMIDSAAAMGGDFGCDFRFIRPDGSIRWARSKGRVELDVQGRMTRITGIDLDITEQKNAEIERGYLAAIVESSTDAIVSKNLNGVVTSWNRSAEQLYGYTAQEMLGQPIVQVVPNDRLDEEKAILERISQGEIIQHYETVRIRKDGKTFPVSLSISPIRDAQGAIIGGSKIARDISERKHVEEALRRSSRQLELADQRKDEFLAMLAHELRNPLTPILNTNELLKRSLGSQPEMQAPLAMLSRQTEQLTRLVDDLLDISRISQGRVVLQQQPLDVSEVIDQAVETVQPLIATKRHRFFVTKPTKRLYIRGDRARLVQSVGNLLHNAAKYTDPGGQIAIAWNESNEQIVFEIRDNGAGISTELLPHVFDLFVQSQRTLDRSQGGLGIGLSVVKRLIELHGGSVEAHSDGLGCGSTFTIRLPSIAIPNEAAEESALLAAPARRILVVDDNIDVADSLVMLLKLDGHDVRAVYSAAAALELAQTLAPEVIILDIGLPDMDGYEVARRLRANNAVPRIHLVAVTGYGQKDDRTRAQAAGFDHHLVKPASLGALQEILSKQSHG